MSRRSENVALTTLVVSLGAMFIISTMSNRNAPRQQRNRYATQADCSCEYNARQCSYDSGHGRYVGPWYASDPVQRRRDADDPGPGRSCSYTGSSGSHYGGGYGRATPSTQEGQSVSTGLEMRERGGFGRTGRSGGYRFTG